jgi:phenylacetate-CoA ligase
MASTAHEVVSRRVLLPLVQWRRALRPSQREALLAYREGIRFRRESLGWDVERRREWVLRRLRLVVRGAARETEHYRQLFDDAGFDPEGDFEFDDFARLPVLERDTVASAGRRIISTAVDPDQLTKQSTGGSTGAPTEVWQGPEERGWGESGVAFPLARIGVPHGSSTGLFWGHHLDPVARETLRDRFHDFEANVRWFDCFRLSPDVLESYHRAFERWRPGCIIAYASALASLAEHVLEHEHRPSYPTRCFVTGAEKLLPTQLERIETAFGRPVHERYGSREVGPIAFQLRPRETLDYDIDWPNVLVEPETDDPTTSILVTKLHADGMPMLRYRIGDLGSFDGGGTPGHPTFVLPEVVGRDIDRIWLPSGKWVHPVEIPHLMKDHPVREFMFLQRSDYSIEIQVVPRSEFGEDSRRVILQTVTENLPGIPVELVLVDEVRRISASKLRPIVSEVERAGTLEENS